MRIVFILLILLALCGTQACRKAICPEPAPAPPTPPDTSGPALRVNELGTTDTLVQIVMTSESVGYIVGYYSKAYKTVDAGATWQRMPIYDGEYLVSLSFTSPTIGYIGNTTGKYYKTTDAGETWNEITSPNPLGFTSSYDVDANSFYLTGYVGSLYKTMDAGLTYTQIPTIVTTNLYCVHVLPDGTILAGTSAAGIIRSTNNGANWTFCNNPGGGSYNIGDIEFLSNSVGFATAYSGSGFGQSIIMKTTDGGVNWTAITNPDPATHGTYQQIEFVDNLNGFIVGGDYINQVGKYLKTTDGGNTWTVVDSGTMRLIDQYTYNGKIYAVGFGAAFEVIVP